MPDLAALLPAGPGFALGPGSALLLVLLSAFTALLTAGLGLGGGVLLLGGTPAARCRTFVQYPFAITHLR